MSVAILKGYALENKNYYLEDEKYHVGRFSITGAKYSLSFVGVVEIKKDVISAHFWIFGDSFDKKSSVSMALNSIEFRSISKALLVATEQKDFHFKKNTGGHTSSKEFTIVNKDGSVWLNLSHNNTKTSVSLSLMESLALSDEIKKLSADTVDASYKLQRLVSRKKEKLEKEKKERV